MHAKIREVLAVMVDSAEWHNLDDALLLLPRFSSKELREIMARLHADGWAKQRVRRRKVEWCINQDNDAPAHDLEKLLPSDHQIMLVQVRKNT